MRNSALMIELYRYLDELILLPNRSFLKMSDTWYYATGTCQYKGRHISFNISATKGAAKSLDLKLFSGLNVV